MSVTVSEILIAAQGALAAVSSETAGYLVLGAADCLGDAALGVSSVYLDEGGALRVDRRSEPAGTDAESDLRVLLKRLLDTGRSPAPALLRVASTQERRGVQRLVTEIEAALIPVNRAAARRALARLHRDVSRARAARGPFPESAEGALYPEPSKAPPAAPVIVASRTAPSPPRSSGVPVVVGPSILRGKVASTEGPTPVVTIVEESSAVPERPVDVEATFTVVTRDPEPVPSRAIEPDATFAVAVTDFEPVPSRAIEPDATPFLGTVAASREVARAAVHRALASEHDSEPDEELWADVDVEGPDTDPAPPVHLGNDGHGGTPLGGGTTAVMGTYGAIPAPAPVAGQALHAVPPEESADAPNTDDSEGVKDERASASTVGAEPACDVEEPAWALDERASGAASDEEHAWQESPMPTDGARYVAIQVVAVRERAPSSAHPGSDEAADDDPLEREAAPDDAGVDQRDGLELALFDAAAARDDVPAPFTSMFELAPDATGAPPDAVEEEALFDALPPLVFGIALRATEPDAIAEELGLDVPATPAPAASLEEPSFGHLAEALIDEALAVYPRPPLGSTVAVESQHLSASLRVGAARHTETVPGLGFLSVEPSPSVGGASVDVARGAEALAAEPATEGVEVELAAGDRDAVVAGDGLDVQPRIERGEVDPEHVGVADCAVDERAVVSADEDAADACVADDVAAAGAEYGAAPPGAAPSDDAALRAEADYEEADSTFWDEEPFQEYQTPTPSDIGAGAASVASTYRPRRSDVAELVAAFVVAETRSLAELTRELKRIAGISATPAPPPAVSERRGKVSSAR